MNQLGSVVELLLKLCAATVTALPFVYDITMEKRMQRIITERTRLSIPRDSIRDLIIVGAAYSATGDARVAIAMLTLHRVAQAYDLFESI